MCGESPGPLMGTISVPNLFHEAHSRLVVWHGMDLHYSVLELLLTVLVKFRATFQVIVARSHQTVFFESCSFMPIPRCFPRFLSSASTSFSMTTGTMTLHFHEERMRNQGGAPEYHPDNVISVAGIIPSPLRDLAGCRGCWAPRAGMLVLDTCPCTISPNSLQT
jgi:hypothetical protein